MSEKTKKKEEEARHALSRFKKIMKKICLSFGGFSENTVLRGLVPQNTFAHSECASRWNGGQARYNVALSTTYYKALMAYSGYDTNVFIGKTANGDIVGERKPLDPQYPTQVVVITAKGKVKGAEVAPDGTVIGSYTIRIQGQQVSGCEGTLLTACFINEQLQDTEARDELAKIATALPHGENDPFWASSSVQNAQGFAKVIARLGDNFYRRCGFNAATGTPLFSGYPETNDDIEMISSLNDYLVTEVITKGNTPSVVKMAQVKPSATKKQTKAMPETTTAMPEIDLGEFGEPNYTEAQKANVAKTPVGFRWVKWIVNLTQTIVDSFRYDEPTQVMYLVGPAGCGKSIGLKGVAAMLRLVYMFYTCNPDTDVFAMFGEIQPNTSKTKVDMGALCDEMGLPRPETLTADPDRMYEVLNAVMAEASRRSGEYKFVEGPLTQALRYGYLLEIQEIGIVRRAGVAVALNAILESGKDKEITLPTGEVIKKDPHCIIAFTSNDEYEGTTNLNQSVLSRMDEVLYFKNPTPEAMAERAKAVVTDFPDDTTLVTMATYIQKISDELANLDITDGVCGQRELTNWAKKAMFLMRTAGETTLSLDMLREAAQTTVLNKVSQSRENIEQVADASGFNHYYGEMAMTVKD